MSFHFSVFFVSGNVKKEGKHVSGGANPEGETLRQNPLKIGQKASKNLLKIEILIENVKKRF